MLRIVLRGGVVALFSVWALLSIIASQGATAHSQPAQPISASPRSSVPSTTSAYTIGLQLVTTGLSAVTDVRNAGDGSHRLFVVEQAGTIRVIRNGVLQNTPFLTVTNKILNS